MRWRMLIEEYDAQYEHVKGVDNVVADGISRLASIDSAESPLESKPEPHLQSYALSRITRDETIEINHTPGQEDFADSYVMEKDIEETEFPMASKLIRHFQKKDKKLKKAIQLDTKGYQQSSGRRAPCPLQKKDLFATTTACPCDCLVP
jgi:hypothetical protein